MLKWLGVSGLGALHPSYAMRPKAAVLKVAKQGLPKEASSAVREKAQAA